MENFNWFYTCIISSTTGKFLLEVVAIKYMQVNCCEEKLIVVYSHSLCTATTITEGPVSVMALVGTNAQFHCTGIYWYPPGVGSGWTIT